MRLLSWNVRQGGSAARRTAQVAAIAGRSPDVIALQEILPGSVAAYREALAAAGFSFACDSFEQASDHSLLRGSRAYGELIASRIPLDPLPTLWLPWPERLLSCCLRTALGPVVLHTAHVPTAASQSEVKLATMEGIVQALAVVSPVPRILCGDFNVPREELSDGTLITWAQRRNRAGKIVLIPRYGERWDRAERSLMLGLAGFDLADSYRRIHGYARTEPSWYWKALGRTAAYRLDHVFASGSLNPTSFTYLHEFVVAGLSDHAPAEVLFLPDQAAAPASERASSSVAQRPQNVRS